MKPIGRRQFLMYSAGLLGIGALSQVSRVRSVFARTEGSLTKDVGVGGKDVVVPQGRDGFGTVIDPTKKFGLVIDIGACIGCRTCMWGCKAENNTPDEISPLWIEVFQLDSSVELTGDPSVEDLRSGATTDYTQSPLPDRRYMPVQCMHCDNAPCVKVCPTGATYKDADGLVGMDYDRCIGCRLCVVACPYSARRFNWYKGQVAADKVNPLVPVRPVGVPEKCTLCVHRVRRGQLPRCVEVCPVRARHFGDMNDPDSEISKILAENMSFRLLEDIDTQPSIRYITRGKKWLP